MGHSVSRAQTARAKMRLPEWGFNPIRRPRRRDDIVRTRGLQSLSRFREIGVLVFLLLVAGIASVFAPRFLQPENLRTILLDIPLLVVVAMGMTLLILCRNIDLSVGAILGMSGMLVAMLFRSRPELPIFAGILLGIVIGLVLGAVNGLLVTWLRVPAILATLGTLNLYRGLIFTVSGGRQVDPNDIPLALIRLSQTSPFGLPWLVLIALLIAVVFHLFLTYHRQGRALYAIGGEPEAGRVRGLRGERALLLAFVATGGVSGLAGGGVGPPLRGVKSRGRRGRLRV